MELQVMMEPASENIWVDSSPYGNVAHHQQLSPGRSSDCNNAALEQQQVSFCMIVELRDCYIVIIVIVITDKWSKL